jgi:ferrochelatase
LPKYFLLEGDPYPFQISQTVAKVLAKLKREKNWVISYQSAVGPLEWLKPSTEDIIVALKNRGIEKLLVVPISFVSDHIETLCEIDIEYRHFAEKLGINDFRMSKALECHPDFIRALVDSIESVIETDHAQDRLGLNDHLNLELTGKSPFIKTQ